MNWSDDRGRIGDRIASIRPAELHRSLAHAAAEAIRAGVAAELLDGRRAARSGKLIGVGPDRHVTRLAHLDQQISDADRRAVNARRNANLTDDAEIAAELLADAADARDTARRLRAERQALPVNRHTLSAEFSSEADYVAHALANLATIEHDTDAIVADALSTILEITAMTVSADHDTVDIDFCILVPADENVARLGPIHCTVDNRAYRGTLPGAVPAEIARQGLVQAADRNGLTASLKHRHATALLRVVADALVAHGYTRLAASLATRAAAPSLHAVLAHDLWDEPLPDGIDPAYVDHVLATYRSPAFAWDNHRHTLDPTARQALVDAVATAGGRLDTSELVPTLGSRGAQLIRVFSRPQQIGSAPPWMPCLERGGQWGQGRLTKDAERYLTLVDCPHCGGHATVVSRTPETPACLLCPDCRRMPTPDSPVFPEEYITPRA